MVNYQLYRTNVLLGGQMKWDIILDDIDGNIQVSDFHLSPISSYVPHNKYGQQNLINYPHQENVKLYYQDIIDSFYKDESQSRLDSIYPIITVEGEENTSKTYEDMFEMGCRRMSYQLYGKQFEFFCPIWLEELKENQYLKFEFIVKSPSSNQILSHRELILNTNDISQYHDKFVKYFNDYIKYCGIDKGNNRLIYVDLDNVYSTISGVDVNNGLFVDKKTQLAENMLSIERPLLENDALIINSFKQQRMISAQLFNFNFCFNLDDILYSYMGEMIGSNPVLISINVGIGDSNNQSSKLKIVDFYSNYEFIPRKYCGPNCFISDDITEDSHGNIIKLDYKQENVFDFIGQNNAEYIIDKFQDKLNVLTYLKDYKCPNLVDQNKIVQSVIHWSLTDSNDYIFNLYPGFEGYHIDKNKKLCLHSRNYDGTPDISIKNYDEYKYNVGWCNLIDISNVRSVNILYDYLFDLILNDNPHSTNFKPGARAKNILCPTKIANNPNHGISYNGKNNEYQLNYEFNITLLYGGEEYSSLNNRDVENKNTKHKDLFLAVINKVPRGKNSFVYTLNTTNKDLDNNDIPGTMVLCLSDVIHQTEDDKLVADIYLYTDEINNFTFKNTKEKLDIILDEMYDNDEYDDIYKKVILHLSNIMNTMLYNNIHITSCNQSLRLTLAESPSTYSDEIQYYKENKKGITLLREYGSLRPTFVDNSNDVNFNYSYSKKIMNENSESCNKFAKWIRTGFKPLYPSLGYFPLEKEIQTYNKIKDIPTEYNSFNINKMRNLIPSINVQLQSIIDENNKYVSIEDMILRYLGEIYNETDDSILIYINNLYDKECSFEYKYDVDGYPETYETNKNMFKYIHTIKMNLK